VEVYAKMLQCCQNILDKFVAMRVAIANNVESASMEDTNDDSLSMNSDTRVPIAPRQPEDLILGIAPPSLSQPTTPTGAEHLTALPQNPELLPYRRELVGSVLLCFYIYSGALILKQPLPTYLPPARAAKKRLLTQIREVIVHAQRSEALARKKEQGWNSRLRMKRNLTPEHVRNPERYINYYAYALSLEDVINELELLGGLLKILFGEMFADVVQYDDHQWKQALMGTSGANLDLMEMPATSSGDVNTQPSIKPVLLKLDPAQLRLQREALQKQNRMSMSMPISRQPLEIVIHQHRQSEAARDSGSASSSAPMMWQSNSAWMV
jgi:hypothetical protein